VSRVPFQSGGYSASLVVWPQHLLHPEFHNRAQNQHVTLLVGESFVVVVPLEPSQIRLVHLILLDSGSR
jgi:hypothetical protein